MRGSFSPPLYRGRLLQTLNTHLEIFRGLQIVHTFAPLEGQKKYIFCLQSFPRTRRYGCCPVASRLIPPPVLPTAWFTGDEVGPSSWTGIAAPPQAADGWPDDCAGNKEEIVRICENLLAEVGFGTADNEPSSASNDFYLHVIFVQSAG